jgi:hypothetical protein
MPLLSYIMKVFISRSITDCTRSQYSTMCGGMPKMPALQRKRQENCQLEASLDYTVRFCLKTTATNHKNNSQEKPFQYNEPSSLDRYNDYT